MLQNDILANNRANWQRWKGKTIVCLASGPSLTKEDADYCRGKAKIITVNSTYLMAPWADVHYSSDHDWWELHLPKMREICSGEFWTGYPAKLADDIKNCPFSKPGKGLSRRPGIINWGGNSGYCAVGLAYQFGAKKIILLGYDMKDTRGEHWHGQHEASIRKGFNFKMWIPRFCRMANDLRRINLTVVNCTRDTALKCFPQVDLRKIL